MESILHTIRSLYGDMGRSEKKLADYILNNTDSVVSMSISELAERSGSAVATAVRFSRRLGFGGFSEMKIGLAKELSSASAVSSEISPDDTCFEIFRKRINDVAVSLANTETVLNADDLQEAADTIMHADRLLFFGLGNSAGVARDAAHKFIRLGYTAQACDDNHLQTIMASNLKKGDVVVGISHSGKSRDIIEAVSVAKNAGAKTICLTQYRSSPLTEVCDISLFTKSAETEYSILAMSSRIAQLTIFDAIYTYVVVKSGKKAAKAIFNTEMSVESKKMRD